MRSHVRIPAAMRVHLLDFDFLPYSSKHGEASEDSKKAHPQRVTIAEWRLVNAKGQNFAGHHGNPWHIFADFYVFRESGWSNCGALVSCHFVLTRDS